MRFTHFLLLVTLLGLSVPAAAQDQGQGQGEETTQLQETETETETEQAAELTKKLNNPVASLISLPINFNYDQNIGPEETGTTFSAQFTPVYPIDISENWNLIARGVVSYLDQDIPEYGLDETGFSDIVLEMFFSPKEPTKGGVIWGVGPIALLDTATKDSMGYGKWGLGPAGVVLKQTGPWTVGALGFYLTDIGGGNNRADVEQLFFQPFIGYNLPNGKTSFTLQSEITRDLEADDTGAFVSFTVNQMFRVGSQIMQGRIGIRHWYSRMGYGPDSTQLTGRLTFLWPK